MSRKKGTIGVNINSLNFPFEAGQEPLREVIHIRRLTIAIH